MFVLLLLFLVCVCVCVCVCVYLVERVSQGEEMQKKYNLQFMICTFVLNTTGW